MLVNLLLALEVICAILAIAAGGAMLWIMLGDYPKIRISIFGIIYLVILLVENSMEDTSSLLTVGFLLVYSGLVIFFVKWNNKMRKS